MKKHLILLFPLLFCGCFTASKSAFDELISGSKSNCPIASNNYYRALKEGKTNYGMVKFGAGKLNSSETACFLTAGKDMDEALGTDLKSFVDRKFYKINSELFIAYISPYIDKSSLYFIQSDKKGGWYIFGTCKMGKNDCPAASSKQAILDFAKELPNQTPSYVLEVVK